MVRGQGQGDGDGTGKAMKNIMVGIQMYPIQSGSQFLGWVIAGRKGVTKRNPNPRSTFKVQTLSEKEASKFWRGEMEYSMYSPVQSSPVQEDAGRR